MRLHALGILLFVLAGGCAGPIGYEPGGTARVVKAPQNGEYHLYQKGDDAPVWSAILLKGDAIGYRRDSTARLVAVADVQRLPLAEHAYRWQHVELAEHGGFDLKPLLAAAPVVAVAVAKFTVIAAVYVPMAVLARASRHWGPGGGHR